MQESAPNLQKAIASFHTHLDSCGQCRENPFQLCFVGSQLLHFVGELSYRKQEVVKLP